MRGVATLFALIFGVLFPRAATASTLDREVFLRVANTRGIWAYYLPLDVTLAFSALYEIMEMVVATMVAPGTGDAWLGTQGDVWDAQKDMGLAALGALICMVLTAVIRRIRTPRPVLLAGERL